MSRGTYERSEFVTVRIIPRRVTNCIEQANCFACEQFVKAEYVTLVTASRGREYLVF